MPTMLETTSLTSEAAPQRPLAPRAPRPPQAPRRAGARPRSAAAGELDARFEREALPQLQALYAGACRLTRDVADAEDLVQETYLRAFRAFHLYQPGSNIRAWLFTILYRVRADHFRKVARAPRMAELPADGPAVEPAQSQLADGHELVQRALARLPEPFRSAVVLRDMQDFSYEEIAGILEVPIGTVMSRIHRGRAQLRQLLSGAGA
jgi:RNA polymerase sigma-70 factor (ECF subfamily)